MKKPERKENTKEGLDYQWNRGFNAAWNEWEEYHKWVINQILCDMQESPAKEYHKKKLEE